MYVSPENRFKLPNSFCDLLRKRKPAFGFDIFGEVVYYRTYSRLNPDGTQEHWPDTVIRVVNGILSIRKWHYLQNNLPWDEDCWQKFAQEMAEYMFEMKFLPSGRGLWALGTEYVYKRGSAALFNCGYSSSKILPEACDWTMDMLMCGCGVGFDTKWEGKAYDPDKSPAEVFIIPDTREGWAESVKKHISTYIIKGSPKYKFDYSRIRKKGSAINGFGGTASGPEPLELLHKRIDKIFGDYLNKKIDKTRVVVDLFDSIGVCVVSGNVRRSAMIALGNLEDETFVHLKDYEKFPDRDEIGWMSNNSVILEKTEDFLKLPSIVENILQNGEPGIINMLNIQKYGRVRYGEEKPDKAIGINPCGEEPLEDKETCNLAEVYPTQCKDKEEFLKALTFAMFYVSTVALLPTHRPETNRVIFRNRRVGVGLSGIADWYCKIGCSSMIRYLRDGYRHLEKYNKELADEAGVPVSIRLTTVKPSGTLSQLVGVSSGMNFPTFKYAIRRIRIAQDSKLCELLKEANIPNEPDKYSVNTQVFEFPIDQGTTRKATDVSVWEQFALLATLQREWSDSAVSCTLFFDKEKEADQLEHALSQFIPVIKSVSLLPHSTQGAYEQMPYEGITQEEYERRVLEIGKIDWEKFCGSDGIDQKYCTNDTCSI